MALIPKIRFPVPSSGRGEEFGSPEELLSVLAGESSGLYLVGSQGMWHGGIHITDATVPWCALTGQNASELAYVSKPYPGEQPVRCMADGKIVAYRICKDYDAIEWRSDRLFFSTSFVLAEHYVQPGEQASSGLKFYTLYMNLAPVSAYGQPDAGLRETAKVLNYYRSPDDVNAARASGTLPAGTRLKLGNQVMTSAYHHRQFSAVSVVNDTDLLKAGDIIWTVSDQGWLKPLTGEEKIPSWWKKCSLALLSEINNGQLYKTSAGLNMYFSAEDIQAGKECGVLPKHFPVTTDSTIPVFTRPKDQRVFSLVTLGRDYNKLKQGDRVWLVSDHDNLTAVTVRPAGTGKYDEVVVPATPITINAGDSIGHLGFFELPQENGKRSRYQVHIECLSADSHLPAFLSNPDKVDEDNPVYLSYAEGADLYMPDGQGKMVSAARKSQLSGILTRSKVKGVDADGKILSDNLGAAYYQVLPEKGWMAASDVKKVAQYDLAALGFVTLDKMPESFDLIDGIHHPDNVVKGILEALYQAAQNETDSSRMLNQYNYQRLLQNIDNNNDGQYSEQEYLQAIHNISYRDHLYRLIVKHPSEWYYGKDDAYWKPYLDTLAQDTALAAWKNYTESFISKMAWMKQVPGMVAEPWHMHPVTFLSMLKTETECVKLIWGDVVNQRLGAGKACQFRKKVVEICKELWGEEHKLEYANTLMACMAVETARLFTSSVVKLMPKVNTHGDVIVNSNGKPVREYRAVTREELNADPSIAAGNAVGLIQFTGPAINQINKIHGLSVTKQQLALMDELEQLYYVKLYFTSNRTLFNKIKTSDDIYLYIFCPSGVGQNNDFSLYSRQKDKDESVNYYEANASLDSGENGNQGNNDGIIQRRELLTRLNKLKEEGRQYKNKCLCNHDVSNIPKEPGISKEPNISKEPSGIQWVNRFPTSKSVNDLLPSFKSSLQNFIQSINDAGGHVWISATYRPAERVYLMHYSWKISQKGMNPASVPFKEGVNIDWTHNGNHTAAVAAAADMFKMYDIVYGPALSTRHTQRRAVDMTITGIIGKSLKDGHGTNVTIRTVSELYRVGASFGVYKLVKDAPHWSDDGH